MKIAVTTPTGNIGSKLTPRLLEAGAEVTLLVRDKRKVEPWIAKGAKAVEGSVHDGDYLTRATAGADALFWVTPPDMGTDDLRGLQVKMGKNVAEAVRANKIPRVVTISSVGAQVPEGTGPIAGLGRIEKLLDGTGAAIRHLRCAFFMENFLMSLDGVKQMGEILMPASGDTRLPMIATRDIAEAAARILLDDSWKGQKVLGLHGPADLSFDEAAAGIAEGIGRPVEFMPVTPDQTRQVLTGMGVSPQVADMFLEMYASFQNGTLVVAEPRTPETTTPTTITAFARETLKPLL